MPPRRILLTGASGFVAGHLVPRLRAAFPAAELTLCGLGAVRLDVTDTDAVHALVRDIRPDACVHLAAVSTVPGARRDPDLAWRVNLHGSLALARAVLAHVPDCVFLHVSSSEIYGRSFRAGVALDEAAAAAPMNLYAATKAAADLALGAMVAEGLRVIRLRPFNHTGPGQTEEFVVPAFARQVARIAAGAQPPVMRVGALDPQRDFLDVRDVCSAYVACLERADRISPGAIFNIASGVPRRIGDVLQRLLDLAGVTATLETGAALLRPAEIPIAAGNADAARAALAWRPVISWEQTLRDVLQVLVGTAGERTMTTRRIGDATVTRIEERVGPGFEAAYMFPDWDPTILAEHGHWMIPDYFEAATGKFISSIHSWLIRTRRHVILVDTCCGNLKPRPDFPRFNMLNTPYLEHLREAGVTPEQVDYVLCTHLHVDHVGWNTQLVDGRWVPTFPNAKYVFSRVERDHWDPARNPNVPANAAVVYQDSVLPVVEAGLEHIVDMTDRLGDDLLIEPAPGHTPGHVVLRLRDGGEEGIFIGDVMHQPIQVYRPEWSSRFCDNPDQAHASRLRVLAHCAEHNCRMFPTHFGPPHVGRISRTGDRFALAFDHV